MLCERLPPAMKEGGKKDNRVMMGKSACDDGNRFIENDLGSLESDTHCDIKYDREDREVSLRVGKEGQMTWHTCLQPQWRTNHKPERFRLLLERML